MQMPKKSRQITYVPYLFLERRCASRRYLDTSVVTLGRANKAKTRCKVKKKLANEKQNDNNLGLK